MKITKDDLEFIKESNAIERIYGAPTKVEVEEYKRFLSLLCIPTIEDLERFVAVYQPGARLRAYGNMNVTVEKIVPKAGGYSVAL